MATRESMNVKQGDRVTIKAFQATVSGTVAYVEYISMFEGWHIELLNATTPTGAASWYQNRDGGMVTHINGRAIYNSQEKQLSENGIKYLVRYYTPNRNLLDRMLGPKTITKGQAFTSPDKAAQYAQQCAKFNPEVSMIKQFQHKGTIYYDSFMPGNPIHQILSEKFRRITQYYEGMSNHIAALEECFSSRHDYCELP